MNLSYFDLHFNILILLWSVKVISYLIWPLFFQWGLFTIFNMYYRITGQICHKICFSHCTSAIHATCTWPKVRGQQAAAAPPYFHSLLSGRYTFSQVSNIAFLKLNLLFVLLCCARLCPETESLSRSPVACRSIHVLTWQNSGHYNISHT